MDPPRALRCVVRCSDTPSERERIIELPRNWPTDPETDLISQCWCWRIYGDVLHWAVEPLHGRFQRRCPTHQPNSSLKSEIQICSEVRPNSHFRPRTGRGWRLLSVDENSRGLIRRYHEIVSHLKIKSLIGPQHPAAQRVRVRDETTGGRETLAICTNSNSMTFMQGNSRSSRRTSLSRTAS